MNKNWNIVSLAEVVDDLKNTTHKPIEEGYQNYIGFEHLESQKLGVRTFGNLSDGVTFNKTFKEGDILFGKIRAYLKKVAIAPFDGLCSGDILVLRSKDEKILRQEILPYILSTDSFFQNAIDTSIGTTMPRTKWKYISSHKFHLPPLSKQKQIAELFQSIETVIEQLEQQQKNYYSLHKKLINELVSEEPAFGNLLKGKVLKRVNYSDVTEKLMRKIDPIAHGIERIAAGENLESEDFKIRSWGTVGKDFLGPAFHVLFKPGDILYGSRRTYLKKVAVADFEGVCANTTYVIRSNESILLQGLLKHIMLSERFTQYSIGVSKGSTNPYINWKDLDTFSFQIPSLDIQKRIVEILDSIIDLIEEIKTQKQTLKNLKQKLLNEILG